MSNFRRRGLLDVTKTIFFYINDYVYICENNMTWSEWVNSDYNTDGFRIMGEYVLTSNKFTITTKEFTDVKPTDLIQKNGEYIAF